MPKAELEEPRPEEQLPLRKALGVQTLDPERWGGAPYRLWPGLAPGQKKKPKDEEYFTRNYSHSFISQACAPHDWTLGAFQVSTPLLTPFVVPFDQPNRRNVAMLVIPGGGGEFVGWEKEGADLSMWLNKHGINAFALKYRVPNLNKHITGALEDAQRSMSLIRSMALKYKLDPKKIGTIGFSFGGNVIFQLGVSIHRKYTPVDAADENDYRPNFQMAIYAEGSQHFVHPHIGKIPPTFMASDADDQCQPPLLIYETKRLIEATGTKVELHMYGPGGRHAYGLCDLYTEFGKWAPVCNWPKRALEFIQKYGR